MEIANTRLPEELAEILEALWTEEEEGKESTCAGVPADLRNQLHEKELVIEEGPRIRLAKEGRRLAEQIIRRHRLAERLICDALGAHVDESEDDACEFEHVLASGITDSICTLLGHPRLCPHGKPIPQGDCCRRALEALHPILVSSDQLHVGESAVIAYLSTTGHARMLKLSSLGLSPGNRLKLLQKWPSYVFQCDETELALEEGVARSIYVRRSERDPARDSRADS